MNPILNDTTQVTQQASGYLAASCPDAKFFELPTWYQYLECEGNSVVFPRVGGGSDPAAAIDIFSALPLVGLAVLDMLLYVAGMAAVFFVIYGGVSYVISQGEADKLAKARGTIINALIGMAIAIFASAVVRFLGSKLG